ncbi:MAG: MBL fold metallo-hydrolase, partial [Candidatus Micrarchaeota archaeon]|nr:MBL fold metallo-hydrolase [Candidatus Micrarchaeota archaeon]
SLERKVPAAASASQIQHVDAVFLSHEHGDHRDPAALEQIVSRSMCQLIGPAEALQGVDVPERLKMAVSEGERFSIGGIDVQITPAKHPQSVHPVGFAVSSGGQSVYHAGDTYDFHGLSGITADVGLLPIGGTFTMDVLGAITALKRMRLKKAVPMHYNTFDQIRADPRDFEQRARQTKTAVSVMAPGDCIELQYG